MTDEKIIHNSWLNKSYSDIRDVETIQKIISKVIQHQYMFEKKTSWCELKEWKRYAALEKFRIDIEHIDHLYYINNYYYSAEREIFELIIKIYHNEEPLYVEITANCDNGCAWRGCIFVTRNVDLFMKLIYNNEITTTTPPPPLVNNDFKSLDPNVRDVETIQDIIGDALFYQKMYKKKILDNNDDDCEQLSLLEDFTINVRNIDRLYHIKYSKDDDDKFELIARLNYNNNKLYVEMTANCNNILDDSNFEYYVYGNILLSQNANLFMKFVLDQYDIKNKHLIYQSLREDGIEKGDDDKEI